ncbi:hypothetical protein PA598K_01135 [Paenibacillus sp. 598K]|uniref:hypothetical protein n=1 Tax=Paenibacillus sp. 598K TaxID=1117987 RepID=UPI000FF9600E|nr:hypothetical protein [Paenibacillus sp. 598K]GBF72860.1 hypothetical protein PA598K_01135 [Paenibacillus sp. 598K]
MNTTTSVIFIVSAFVLGGVIMLYRESIPDKLRRPLALSAIGLIAFAFFLIVYSLFSLGS